MTRNPQILSFPSDMHIDRTVSLPSGGGSRMWTDVASWTFEVGRGDDGRGWRGPWRPPKRRSYRFSNGLFRVYFQLFYFCHELLLSLLWVRDLWTLGFLTGDIFGLEGVRFFDIRSFRGRKLLRRFLRRVWTWYSRFLTSTFLDWLAHYVCLRTEVLKILIWVGQRSKGPPVIGCKWDTNIH